MTDEEEVGAGSSPWILIASVIAIIVGFFWFLHGLIKDRTNNEAIIHSAGFTVLFIEIVGIMVLYDRVMHPLATGYRWPHLHTVWYVLCGIYAALFIATIVERIRAWKASKT